MKGESDFLVGFTDLHSVHIMEISAGRGLVLEENRVAITRLLAESIDIRKRMLHYSNLSALS